MEFASRRRSLLALGGGTLAALAASAVFLTAGCHSRHRAVSGPGERATGGAGGSGAKAVVGRVTDEVDRAVPGARLLLLAAIPDDATAPEPRRASTDRAGHFTFAGVEPGRYRLLIEAVGLASTEPPAFEVPGPELVLRLAGQGRSLTGWVAAAGAPVAGARVRLGGPTGELVRETLSDDGGQFVFHGLGVGVYALRATRGGLVSLPARDIETDDAEGHRSKPLRLDLGSGLGLAGLVVDDRGRPQAGAAVRVEVSSPEARGAQALPLDDPLAETGVTGADGRFRVEPLPAGRARVTADAPGAVLRAPALVTLAAGQVAPPQRLELVRGATLSGRIVDARGAAVVGAQVRCVGAGADALDLAVLDAPLPLAAEAAALGTSAGRAVGIAKAVRTDAQGGFRIADLLPGSVHLEIARPPFVPLATASWTLASGEARDLGRLTLSDGVVIHGRVLDEAGAPLAGARVTTLPSVGVIAETDGAGTFALALPAGKVTLDVSAPGFAARSVALDAAAPATVEIKLGHADGTLEGVARDSGHRVLARARVRAFDVEGGAGAAVALGSAVTDAGGHFALKHLPPRELRLELDHPDYPVTSSTATPGTAVELTAPIPGGVDGEVRERVTGAVVARARVDGVGPDGQRASAGPGRRDKKGAGLAFRLARLRPGRWTLTATAPGYVASAREVDVPPSPILGETSVRGLRLELDRSP